MSVLDENVRRWKILKVECEEGLELTGSFIAGRVSFQFLVSIFGQNAPTDRTDHW